MAQADEDGSKFEDLRKEDYLNLSLVNKHIVPVAQWGQAVQLTIYGAKNEKKRFSVWFCNRKQRETYMSLSKSYEEGFFFEVAISRKQKVGRFLNLDYFP